MAWLIEPYRHVEVDSEHNGHLFFWHFANRHIANRQRTVIWLNGGPGCSSMDGVLMEIGPYRVREIGELEYSNGSWDEFANLLFVDNPVGTGFSYVDTDSFIHELDVMADQFITFLEKWFAMFPQYQEDDVSSENYFSLSICPNVRNRFISLGNHMLVSTYPTFQKLYWNEIKTN